MLFVFILFGALNDTGGIGLLKSKLVLFMLLLFWIKLFWGNELKGAFVAGVLKLKGSLLGTFPNPVESSSLKNGLFEFYSGTGLENPKLLVDGCKFVVKLGNPKLLFPFCLVSMLLC